MNGLEPLTLEAISAMDNALSSHRPFFLYMSHYVIHTPIMADDRFMRTYLNMGVDTIATKYASLSKLLNF